MTDCCTLGCFYRGDKVSVGEHKTVCGYKDESQLLAISMKEVYYSITALLHLYINVCMILVLAQSNYIYCVCI